MPTWSWCHKQCYGVDRSRHLNVEETFMKFSTMRSEWESPSKQKCLATATCQLLESNWPPFNHNHQVTTVPNISLSCAELLQLKESPVRELITNIPSRSMRWRLTLMEAELRRLKYSSLIYNKKRKNISSVLKKKWQRNSYTNNKYNKNLHSHLVWNKSMIYFSLD